MRLNLILELETLSERPQTVHLPSEPVLFVVALENAGDQAAEPASVRSSNGTCTGVVRDPLGNVIDSGSFLRLLVAGERMMPRQPPLDKLPRVRLAPGERDEQRGDFLRLLRGPLPPGDYTLQVIYDAPDLRLESPAVPLHIVAPACADVAFAWPAGRPFAHVAMVTMDSAGGAELRHERRASTEPGFLLQHATVASLPRPATAACETSRTPKRPSDPIWLAWVDDREVGLLRSWVGTPQGEPIRVGLDDLEEARLAGTVDEIDRHLFVPVIGRAGRATVLELFRFDAASGALGQRSRVPLSDRAAVASSWSWIDEQRAGLLTAIAGPDHEMSFEAVEFDALSGGGVTRAPLGRAAGRVAALAAGKHAGRWSFIAAMEEPDAAEGARWSTIMGVDPGSALSRRPLLLTPPPEGELCEIQMFLDDDGRPYQVVATDDGGVYAGAPPNPLVRIVTRVAWPDRGRRLAPPARFRAGVMAAFITRDGGLTLRPMQR
jgi:hypothetical protein